MIVPQFPPQWPDVVYILPQFLPEFLSVVLYAGVDQFMEDDVVHQPPGKPGQCLVEAYRIAGGTASPPCLLSSDGKFIEGKTEFFCKTGEPPAQYLLGLLTRQGP